MNVEVAGDKEFMRRSWKRWDEGLSTRQVSGLWQTELIPARMVSIRQVSGLWRTELIPARMLSMSAVDSDYLTLSVYPGDDTSTNS